MSIFHAVGFVMWGFVLWEFVSRDFILCDFVLCDSVSDSFQTAPSDFHGESHLLEARNVAAPHQVARGKVNNTRLLQVTMIYRTNRTDLKHEKQRPIYSCMFPSTQLVAVA